MSVVLAMLCQCPKQHGGEHAPTRHASASKARWKFVSSPLGVIHLLAVLPFWLAFVLPVLSKKYAAAYSVAAFGSVNGELHLWLDRRSGLQRETALIGDRRRRAPWKGIPGPSPSCVS